MSLPQPVWLQIEGHVKGRGHDAPETLVPRYDPGCRKMQQEVNATKDMGPILSRTKALKTRKGADKNKTEEEEKKQNKKTGLKADQYAV